MQSWIWGGAFLGFVVLCLWCMRELPVLARTNDVEVEAGTAAKWSWPNIALWILLSAVTSALLLSVTNNLCQDIAVVPFLWVLPLVIYLLTFILCFESSRWYSRRWFLLASVIATAVVLVTNFQGVKLKIPAHVVSYSVFLFLFCMTCHGELVRLKPAAQHLTAFYLAIAAGGAAGALFVGLGAPVWFKGTWELHITLLLGWLALAWVFARDKSSLFFKGDRLCFVLLLALITYAVMKTVFAFAVPRPGQLAKYDVLLPLLGAAAIAALASLWSRRAGKGRGKIWPRVLVGAVIFIAECFLMNRVRSTYLSSVEVARNFYGTIRVTRHDIPGERRVPALYLAHGHISHGFQFLEPELRQMPTAYYSTNSGLGIALRVLPRRNHGGETNINIGVLGLGAGTIAAFAREHDTVRFYEINPAVTDLSLRENPRFTFVRECRGRATVAPGDARLALEQELARNERGNFDVLVMDAFAGDSVPVHLLTVEAVETYLQHMRDERGIIAVNISNRYLDFRDLMHAIAARFRMRVVIIDNRGDPPDRTPSRWCLFTRDAAFMELPEISRARMPYTPKPVPVWTDQFSNMLRLLL
jgi:hypothetical protein